MVLERAPLVAGLLGAMITGSLPARGAERFRVELEGGAAWQSRNEFAIPGDTGTRVDLAAVESGPAGAFRGTLTWDAGERWSLRLLVAPLRLEAPFSAETPIEFDGVTFPAGEDLEVRYRFDSYRLSWIYALHSGERWSFRAGVTAKIRAAEIRIDSRTSSQSYTNVGFVPLLHGAIRYQVTDGLALELEADAMAAPQGRAEDVALKADVRLSDRASAFFGYRFVEGGADNDKVYTFSFFHYAVAGLSVRF
jgi:hypothetical protein